MKVEIMAFASERIGAQGALGLRITALRDSVTAYLRQRRVYRNTLSELRALSDRELNDLGLNRSMLARLAYEAAYKAQ